MFKHKKKKKKKLPTLWPDYAELSKTKLSMLFSVEPKCLMLLNIKPQC